MRKGGERLKDMAKGGRGEDEGRWNEVRKREEKTGVKWEGRG